MNFHQILRKLKPEPIPRADDVPDRVVRLGLLARFFDELLGGLPDLLLPTIRDLLGLSYTQASLLWQITDYVAVVVEPLNGLFIDLWQRRWLLGLGAIFTGLAVMVMGVAPTFLLLALGFFLYGIGSGPLAHTADVVLVESHPAAPDRIYARSTMIDTIGALLPPVMVAVTFWLELPWRTLLLVNGGLALIYAGYILRTRFPGPAGASTEDDEPAVPLYRAIGSNIRSVLTNRAALFWLAFLLLHDVSELPFSLQTLWLADEVGMSQFLISVYRGLALAVNLIALFFLDRWLQQRSRRHILLTATLLVLLLLPLWLYWPGVWPRFLLGIPLSFYLAMFWPIMKAQSLASAPGLAGTVGAVNALFGLLPLRLLYGVLADRVGLTSATLLVQLPAFLLMLLLVLRLPASSHPASQPPEGIK